MRGDPVERFRSRVRRVDKPWGYEIHFALTDAYCGKILSVRAGEALSLQYHQLKDETLYLHQGRATLDIGERGAEMVEAELGPGESVRIPPGTVHRLVALEDCVFLEASTPQLDDVVRLDDRYGRAAAGGPDTAG